MWEIHPDQTTEPAMLSTRQVLDKSFLDARCMILEIAATLDRYDASVAGADVAPGGPDPRLEKLRQSLEILADRKTTPDRAERLLQLFSDP
jgi:hypothetical protein